MNYSLLDKILRSQRGFLATVLRTEGHTYKKAGAKALYETGGIAPLFGNLGPLCADRDVIAAGNAAWEKGAPAVIRIDTGDETDIHLGYGAYCGGVMEILVEPITEPHKVVYTEVRKRLHEGRDGILSHDVESGTLALSDSAPDGGAKGEEKPEDTRLVEPITPFPKLFVFGATPLAHRLVEFMHDMNYALHVIDWRGAHLEAFRRYGYVTVLEEQFPFDRDSLVLVLSHSFEKDKHVLAKALGAEARYIGMLSSKKRRNHLYAELHDMGIDPEATARIHSPIGIDIGAKTDPEIAVSIVAEIVKRSAP